MIKITGQGKKRFTGLEIEGSYVKLAQAVDAGRLRKIVKLKVEKAASASEKDIVQALKNIFSELKGKTGHLAFCIPRHKVAVRFLNFPSVNKKEIAEMVKLQSAKELPYSKEEIISDYLICGQTKEGYTKVALVIVHQDVINEYLAILKKAGLEPERVTFSTEAIMDWYETTLSKEKPSTSSILIDLDTANTDIVILYDSHLGFTRGLALGTTQLQEKVELKSKLADEIRLTVKGYSSEKTEKIERILLAQAQAVAGLKIFLQEEFGLPCELITALKNLTYEKKISLTQYNLEISLLRVLGMVLGKGRKLNLLPQALREKQIIRLKKEKVYTTAALILGVVLLGFSIFAKKYWDKHLYLSYLDEEIRTIAPTAKGVENIFKKVEVIENRLKTEGSSIDLLRELHKLTPESISLSIFDYDENGAAMTLQGISTNMSAIWDFIRTLEKSVYFKNVQLKYVSEKKAQVGGFTDFKIECNLEK